MWENPSVENKRLKQSMKKIACVANHTSFLHPTHKVNAWFWSASKEDGKSEQLVNDERPSLTVAAPTNNHRKITLSEQVADLTQELEVSARKIELAEQELKAALDDKEIILLENNVCTSV